MKNRLFFSAIALVLLCLPVPGFASPPSPAVQAAQKIKRVAVPKPYSKATRSALQAIDSSQAVLAAAAASQGALPALSPVLTTAPKVMPLESSRPAASEGLSMGAMGSGLKLDDEAAVVEDARLAPERNVSTVASDGDTLGQESISVIDRVAGKPRAQAIASGPLRVRVKDSALRASVSIPVAVR